MSALHIISNTICNPSKSKSGDASFAEIINYNSKEIYMLMVADGVSKSPKDWLASASTIKLIKEFFLINPTMPLIELIEKAICHANNTICNGIDDTVGMLSTLSLLVFDVTEQKIHFANIGDSRIYGYKNQTWHSITIDDSTTKVYKENGKTIMQNGVQIMRSFLTNAIGKNRKLSVIVKTLNAHDFDGYCLLSDGFYEMADWENIISEIYQAAEMKQTIIYQTQQIKNAIRDDASIAIVRLPLDVDIWSLIKLPESEFEKLNKGTLVRSIEIQLTEIIEKENDDKIKMIVEWLFDNKLILPKSTLIELLDKCIDLKNTLSANFLLKEIRKL